MRFTVIMWAALTVVVSVSLFLLKYQVQALEDQLQATYAQIERDKSAIRVLQAEWTYLNDPTRLRRLSEQHLGFSAPAANQVLSMGQIPFRDPQSLLPDASSAPFVPQPPATPAASLRAASLESYSTTAFVPANVQPVGLLQTTPSASNRPSTIAAAVARLQRLLPPIWSGTTSLQEPSR